MGMFRPRAARHLILGLLCLLVSASCAYYNTFYLAKRYYKEGQREQQRSLSDTPSPGAQAKYDLVIRQCRKVIEEYPKCKWVDDAHYLMGAAFYGKGDYPAATKQLTAFVEKYSESQFIPDARFVLGLAHLKRKDFAIADSVLHDHVARFPKFNRRVEVFHATGETQMELRRFEEAVRWFGRAQEGAGRRRERADALRRMGDALFEAARHDSAQEVYAHCLRVEERGPVRMNVALKRTESLREVKRYEEALVFLEEWKPIALVEKREGDLYLRIYEMEALLGRTEDAIRGYRDLVERFPRTNISSEAQFRIGYLCEAALKDYDQAAIEYEKLRSEQVSEFQRQALRRAQGLETMKRYRETLASDTTLARARAAFLVAELYYFQLDKRDSALIQYARVEEEFPKSIYAPKSGYARLWITMNELADTTRAMALTDTLASRYRGTRFAESALYLWKSWSGRVDERVALLDSLLANPDTSRVAEFEREAAPLPGAQDVLGPPTTAGVPGGIGEAEQARLDSLRRALVRNQPEAHRTIRRAEVYGTRAFDRADTTAAADSVAIREPEPVHPGFSPADTAGLPVVTPTR